MRKSARTNEGTGTPSPFATWIRTGRWPVEVKFNPWHDPSNGRFTFAGQGNGGGGASGEWSPFDVRDRHNQTIYRVRRGDSLSKIAATRKGLSVKELANINGISPDAPLQVNQRIKVPTQAAIDGSQRESSARTARVMYGLSHPGTLQNNSSKVPSVDQQANAVVNVKERNGYRYGLDMFDRMQTADGLLPRDGSAPRSRANQANAGKPDRLPTDDGGHYIAPRFNGPSDAFNHFAQNANFNRGAYRAMEDRLDKLRKRHKIFISIRSFYKGLSRRPSSIIVNYSVDGAKNMNIFNNSPGGK